MLDKAQKTGTTAIFDGFSVTGNIKGSHNLYLNGQFEGTIDLTALLLVGKTGKLKGKVKAEYVIIEGEVEGKVIAHEKVELRDGGKYKGEILAPSVMISDNSFFDGIVQMLKKEEKEEEEEKKKEEKEEEAVTLPQVDDIDIKDAEAAEDE
jgi:cytoskeletal protein CcmA (bactofilin family)